MADLGKIKAECAKAQKSAVIIVQNSSSYLLVVKAMVLSKGAWQQQPAPIEAGKTGIVGIKSSGFKAGVKLDLSYQLQNDKNRTYVISIDNPFTETPEKPVTVKLTTALTTSPQLAVIELVKHSISGGQVEATVKISNI
eukprot:TRINITY_DN1940_c0_g1_i2.p1 TRINITY_DN1940_c0_g1~~TRINITY_DN1940_c0_g1_i2.p1  ORF type:complete len:147 (-),score=33.68 TRINITY_DN1940_c0_g1_i2:72-488(-)